jgi:Ca2+-binding RTX toxin-like protein
MADRKTKSGLGTYVSDLRVSRVVDVYRQPPNSNFVPNMIALADVIQTGKNGNVASAVRYSGAAATNGQNAMPDIYLVGATKRQQEIFDKIVENGRGNAEFVANLNRIAVANSEGLWIVVSNTNTLPVGSDRVIGGIAQPGPGSGKNYGPTETDGQFEIQAGDLGKGSDAATWEASIKLVETRAKQSDGAAFLASKTADGKMTYAQYLVYAKKKAADLRKESDVYFARHVIHEMFHWGERHSDFSAVPSNPSDLATSLQIDKNKILNVAFDDKTYGPSDRILDAIGDASKLDRPTLNTILARERSDYGQASYQTFQFAMLRAYRNLAANPNNVLDFPGLVRHGILVPKPNTPPNSINPNDYLETQTVQEIEADRLKAGGQVLTEKNKILAELKKILAKHKADTGETIDPITVTGNIDALERDIETAERAIQIAQKDLKAIEALGQYGKLGSSVGSTLAGFLGGDKTANTLVLSPLLAAIGDNLAEVIANGGVTQRLPSGLPRNVLADFGQELFAEVKGAGVGALSTFLVSELVKVLNLKGVAAEGFSTLGTTVVSQVIDNMIALAGGATDISVFSGVGNLTSLGSAAASFLGGKLADQIVTFDNVGGQIGSALGAAFGAWDSGMFLAAAGLNPVTFAVAVAWVAFWKIAGGFIGSLFGGTPRSGADVAWDETTGRFDVANGYARKGGSKDAAISVATGVSNTLNAVLDAAGGRLKDPLAVQSGNYGMRGKDFVYRAYSTRDKDAITMRWKGDSAASDAAQYGIFSALTDPDFQLVGGDVFAKRALHNHLKLVGGYKGFSATGLFSDLAVAGDYANYFVNSTAINGLIAMSPDQLFTAGWAITLTRAEELGLNRRAASDWNGGFKTIFEDISGLSVGSITFAIQNSQAAERRFLVHDQEGDYEGYLTDTIVSDHVTKITGTDFADVIKLTHWETTVDGRKLVGGSDRLDNTTNFKINGASTDGSAVSMDVGATIDAGAGDDVVHAGDMGNNVFGGAGNDIIYGGRLDDWLLGDEGNDVIKAGDEIGGLGGDGNYLDGGAGDDQLYGREGSDWLDGGTGTDILEGGDGDDILAGGGGDGDILKGGRGNDQYIVRLGDGSGDVVDEVATATVVRDTTRGQINWLGDAADVVRAILKNKDAVRLGSSERFTAAVSADGDDAIVFGAGIEMGDLELKRSGTETAPGGDLMIKVKSADGSFSEIAVKDWFTDPVKRIEWLKFADGNEIRIGDTVNFIVGTPGNDLIIGTEYNDFVVAGDGDDEVHLLGGDDFGSGGTGDDLLFGDGQRDIIVGGLGRDTLYGGADKDMLSGDAGGDEIDGGEGDDTISGGRGDDRLKGGTGNDVFKFSRGDGRDTIVQEEVTAPLDEGLWVDMTDSYGRLTSGYSYDRETGELIDSNGTLLREDVYYAGTRSLSWRVPLRYSGTKLQRYTGTVSTSASAAAGSDRIAFEVGINVQDLVFDTSGPDLVIGIGRENEAVATAADSADRITIRDWNGPSAPGGRPVKEMAFYQAGTIDLGANGKALKGGTAGDDSLAGGSGQDWITGAGGRDTLTGGDSDDILSGGGDGDRLEGEAGADVIYGGAGQDELIGGIGDDVLSGGDDNDMLEGGAGADLLAGGGGDDTASYAASGSGVTASLDGSAVNGGDAAGDEFDSIENLIGSASGDSLFGDDGDNVLEGGDGNDFLRGQQGDDTYVWARGDGDDVIAEGFEEAFTAAGTLDPYYSEDWSCDQVWVSTTPDGPPQLPTIYTGDPSQDGGYMEYHWSLSITGAAGETVFAGGPWIGSESTPPRDTALASNGWRNGFLRTGSGQQVARGSGDPAASGSDTLEFGEGISLSDLTFQQVGSDLMITVGGSGIGTIRLRNQYPVAAVETLQFHDGAAVSLKNFVIGNSTGQAGEVADLLVGGDGSDILNGEAGNDVLSGGAGLNQLYGGAGDDVFEAGTGKDMYFGGAGAEDTVRFAGSAGAVSVNLVNGTGAGGSADTDVFSEIENVTGSAHGDTLVGNELDNELIGLGGDNVLAGNGGSDVLTALGGNDTLDGGEGDDALSAGDGNDVLIGGGGKDVLDGGSGNDTLNAGAGDDQLLGGDGGGTLDGGDGNDLIVGGGGADTMLGGEGADVLDGHGGGDTLQGGAGDDQYVFEKGNGTDTITDGSGKNVIFFGGEVDRSRLWLTRDGDHLRIGVIGSDHVVKVEGFFAASGAVSRMNMVQAGEYTLFLNGPKGQALIQRMTAVEPTDTPDAMNAAIGTDLGLYWTEGNTAPENIALAAGGTIAVAEGTTAIAAAGAAPRFVATDAEGDTFVWSMVNDSGGRFGIDAQTGALSVLNAAALDFESAASHNLTIRATDAQGAFTDHMFTVAVTDRNDRPDIPVLEAGGGAAPEGSNWFARFRLQDQDGTPVLQLVDNPGGLFAVVGNEVRFAAGVTDFESLIGAGYTPVDTDGDGLGEITISGTVRASDGIDMTGTVAVTAVIEDVNESPTDMVLLDRVAGPIAERDRLASDSGPGATTGNRPALVLGKVQVADGDHPSQKSGQYTYQVFENGSTVASQRFTVVDGQLQLLAGKSLDYETDGASIDLRIAATDLTLAPAFSRTFTFAIRDEIDVLGGDEGNNDPLTGQSGQDLILGYGGNDVLVGGTGADTLDGGAGTDIVSYSGSSAAISADLEGKTVVADGVTDSLISIEGVRGSAFADTLQGSSGDDVLEGGAGNDLLNGLGGADRMVGGTGNDIYVVNHSGDQVVELGGEGDDAVYTAMASYTLADNVEKLTGTSVAAGQTLRDNALDNIVTGTALADTIYLRGGGSDTAFGGAGNDAIFIGGTLDAADRIDGGAGNDYVVLQGNTNVVLTGQMLSGVESLYPYTGSDAGYGDTGLNRYSYVIASTDSLVAAGGSFTVDGYALLVGENLTFDGSAETDGSFRLYGGAGVDSLTGGAGGDVFIFDSGRFGQGDTIVGGAGFDTLQFQSNFTTVFAAGSFSGIEKIALVAGRSTPLFNYNLTMADANVAAGQALVVDGATLRATETLTFDGSAETNGTFAVTGGAGNDSLIGGAGADTLAGGLGNDMLSGGAGADQLAGGAGNDVYLVDGTGDIVTELLNEGTDEVRTSLGAYTLAANVENLASTGTGSFKATGNALDNVIQGSATYDYFYLQDGGNDTVQAGAGNDWIYAGKALSAGDVFDGGVGTSDQLALQGNYVVTLTAQQLTNIEFLYVMSGTDTFGGDTSNSRYVYDVTTVDANVAAGARLNVDGWYLVAGENFTFNGSAETDGSFLIDGGRGADNLTGGAGNDILSFEEGRWQAGDKVAGGAGIDTLKLKGAYTIVFAADSMSGIETVQLSVGTALTSYSYSLTMNDLNVAAGQVLKVEGGALRTTEALTFDGSAETNGSLHVIAGAAADTLTGGAGADTLTGGAGDDVIDGRAGADAMDGGAGNDLFFVDNVGDTITERAGEGTDEVRTAIADYTLAANVEKLTATSTTAGQTLRANASDNIVTGTDFNDWFYLTSGGNDAATGGAGTDIFLMGAYFTSADRIDGGAGTDALVLQGNYSTTIGAAAVTGIESFSILTGSDARYGDSGLNRYNYALTTQDDLIASGVQVTFNASGLLATENFTLNGSAETDGRFLMWAGLGIDTLTGGAGDDTFNFAEDRWQAADKVVGGAGADTVMLRGNHTIAFSATALTGVETLSLTSGPSRGTTFAYNLTTHDGNVAAGQVLTVDGSTLAGVDGFTFSGSAETDGSFVIKGGASNDVLTGGAGNDTIDGGAGNDILRGVGGTDTLSGGDNNDVIYGGSGNDTLLGGKGNDQLYAEGDDDVLDGGEGDDLMSGSTGSDKFIMRRDTGADTIENFNPSGEDRDELSIADESNPITREDLWFERVNDSGAADQNGLHMRVSVIGTGASATVRNWWPDSNGSLYRIKFFVAGAYYTQDVNVGTLVNLMTTKTKPTNVAERDAVLADSNYKAQWATVWGVNAKPVVAQLLDQVMNEDGTLSITVNATDDISPAASISMSASAVANGGIVQSFVWSNPLSNGDRTLTITPTANASGSASIVVRATDGGGITSDSKGFTLKINGVPDMPAIATFTGGSGTSGQAGGVPLNLSISFPDTDGSEVQEIAIAGVPAGVTLSAGTYDSATGRWKLTQAQTVGLKVNAPAGWSQDLNLTVTAKATENGSTVSATKTTTVVLNAPPTNATLSGSVNENAAVGIVVGNVVGADPDTGDTLSYRLIDNSGGRFALSTTGVLTVSNGALLNFEAATAHNITVEVKDSFGQILNKTLSVPVNNVNEANSLPSSYGFSINENVALNTVIGTVTASDIDSAATAFGQQRYYFLNGAAASATSSDGRYSIDAVTGAIKTAGAINYETMTSPVGYTVIARDNAGNAGYFQAQTTVTIGVNDLNEPNSLPAGYAMSVNENVALGTAVGAVSATDLDLASTANGQQRYYFYNAGAVGGVSSDSRYAIDAVTGQIKVNAALDFEAGNTSVAYTVVARDRQGVAGTGVIFRDSFEELAAPTIGHKSDGGWAAVQRVTNSASEGNGALRAGMWGGHNWNLPGSSFVATQSTVTLSVMVRDSGVANASVTGGWSGSDADAAAPVLLGLHNETTDVWITATNATATRPPNGGAWVRHVQTITGLTVGQTYSVSAMLNGWEGVRASDIDALQVEYGSVATPFAGWSQAFSTVTVGINNVNEANSFSGSYSFSVSENVAVGTQVGSVAASDVDSAAVAFGQQRYYFWNGSAAVSTSTDGRYAVDAVTGAITTATAINYETMTAPASYTIVARDNQGASGYNQASTAVTIGVANVNEAPNAPAAPASRFADEAGVGSGNPAQAGAVFATYGMTDPDGSTPALQFASGGNPGNWFSISGNQVLFTANFDFEWARASGFGISDYNGDGRQDAYIGTVVVQASDGSLTSPAVGTPFYLSDVNEAPSALSLQSQTFYSETLPGDTPHSWRTIASFGLSDPDGTAPSLAIVGGNGNGWFAISGNSLTFAGADFTSGWLRGTLGSYGQDSGWYYDNDGDGLKEVRVATLTLAAVDSSGLQGSPFTYNVLIEDKNEAPAWNAGAYTFGINENPGSYAWVGAVAGSDVDGPAGELRYGFADGSVYYDGNIGYVSRSSDGRFLINNQNGNVYVNGAQSLDYEAAQKSFSYSTRIVDRSGGAYALAQAGTLTINLQNTNDSSTWYTQVPVGFTVMENTAAGTIVSNGVRASDADGYGISYSIDPASNLYGAFGVNALGQIYVAGAIDHEQTGWLADDSGKYVNLRVLASDGGAAAAETIKINIGNVRKYVYNNGALDSNLYEIRSQSTYVSDPNDPGYYEPGYYGGGGRYPSYGQQSWYNECWLVEKSTGLVLSWMGEYSQWQGTTSRPFPHAGSVAEGYVGYGSYPNPYTMYADQEDIMTGLDGVPQGNPYYPIVFDLAGDGFDLVAIKDSTVTADLNKDGIAEGSGWLKPSDGFLVLDRNGDGLVLDWNEISFVKDKAGASTDLEGLVAFDSNGDLKLAAGDARFDEFRLWVDANQDGIGQSGELRSLSGAGIVSISLVRENIQRIAGSITVNSVLATAAFERTDGTVGRVGDIALGRLPQRGPEPEPGPPQFRLEQSGNSSVMPAAVGGEAEPATGGQRELKSEGTTDMDKSHTGTQPAAAETATAIGTAAEPEAKQPSAQSAQAQADLAPQATELATRSFAGRKDGYSLTASGGGLYVSGNKPDGAIDSRVQEVRPGSLLSFRNGTVGLVAPVVLDLDGDGVALKRRDKSKAGFDMDGNGTRDDTGWISKRDGFLVVDLDGDGRITSPAELSLLGLKSDAKSGLDALAALDSDKNGSIDSKDARFGELKLWVDRNGNGITDAGELRSLADRGIASVGLAARAAADSTVKIGRNAMLSTSTFTRTDGSIGSVGDAALAFRAGKSGGSGGALGRLAVDMAANAAGVVEDRDRALGERLESLRAGLNSRPFQALAAEGDSVFDRFARTPAAAIDDETSLRRMDVPALRVPVDEEKSVEAEAASIAPAADDLRLAKMVQDMASFGLRSGEGEWKNRAQAPQNFDYFA